MKVENKIFNSTENQINGLADETISLLKKLIMILQPKSVISTPFALRIEATAASSQMDNITLMSSISGTVPTVTSISQLGGCGIGNINLNSVSIINNVPLSNGFNYQIGDIVTLSGGTINATVVVYDIYDGNILNIDSNPISGGTGYISGEIVSIDNGVNGTIQIMSVDNSGMAIEIAILEPGYGYNVGLAQQIYSTGSGSGLIVNITSINIGIGAAKYVSLLSGGLNYVVGDYPQIQTNNFGVGLVVSVLNTNTDNGNTNFLQFDESRWLYSDMIRNNLTF
jgi:hypothetical protein